MKHILGIFAHPIDGPMACGGTIAKYAKQGATVDLICATGKEDQRKALEAAATTLGCASLTFLEYKEGTLPSRTPGELEDIIFRKMVDLTPDTFLTYEPSGIDNDPDHIKLTTATTYAFQKYAAYAEEVIAKGISPMNRPRHPRDKWQIPFAEAVANDEEPKLYYACMPESLSSYLLKEKLIPAESFNKPWEGTPDKIITTVIDIKQVKKAKEEALMHMGDPENFFATQEFFYLRMQGISEVMMGKNDRVSNRL